MSNISSACFCIGCQNGEPYCPCLMRAKGIFKRDGHWIEPEKDLGEVLGGKQIINQHKEILK